MRLTKDQIKEAIATVYSRLLSGLTDQEIADEMGISLENLETLKRTMLEIKSTEIKTKPDEHFYVEYMLEQMRNVSDLTDVIRDFKKLKNGQAIVAAIRVRSDIHDKILEKGQQFGFIHREPDKKEIVAGVAIQELSSDKLKKLVLGELGEMNKMMKLFGDNSIIDITEPKQLHFPVEKKIEKLPPAKKDKKNRAKAAKVSSKTRGRKVRPE